MILNKNIKYLKTKNLCKGYIYDVLASLRASHNLHLFLTGTSMVWINRRCPSICTMVKRSWWLKDYFFGIKFLLQFITRLSIPYRRPYRFGHRYDIFRIPVNTGVPFRVYRYFIYLIYIYTHTHTYTHKISIYHKTIPQKFIFTIKHYFN